LVAKSLNDGRCEQAEDQQAQIRTRLVELYADGFKIRLFQRVSYLSLRCLHRAFIEDRKSLRDIFFCFCSGTSNIFPFVELRRLVIAKKFLKLFDS
jgi:hypothetical protein